MNELWHNARFVPHWGTFLIALALSCFIGGVMFLDWQQTTVMASNVTCYVKSSYPGSRAIMVALTCEGHDVTIETPASLVYDIVNKHVALLTCEALYQDESIQGCKYTGIDVGK